MVIGINLSDNVLTNKDLLILVTNSANLFGEFIWRFYLANFADVRTSRFSDAIHPGYGGNSDSDDLEKIRYFGGCRAAA